VLGIVLLGFFVSPTYGLFFYEGIQKVDRLLTLPAKYGICPDFSHGITVFAFRQELALQYPSPPFLILFVSVKKY